MKNILLGLFLISTISASAQKKKDSKVIVSISDTTDIFNKVVRTLYENGYSVTIKDEIGRFIETDWLQLKKTAGKVKTRLLFTDSTITFSSKYRFAFKSEFGEMEADISNAGSKGSDMRIYWDELVRVAKIFGDKLTYSK